MKSLRHSCQTRGTGEAGIERTKDVVQGSYPGVENTSDITQVLATGSVKKATLHNGCKYSRCFKTSQASSWDRVLHPLVASATAGGVFIHNSYWLA